MPRKSYLLEAVTARTGRADLSEYLRELYVERRLTDEEIGDLFGISRGAVNGLRKQFGIDRADRKVTLPGEALA